MKVRKNGISKLDFPAINRNQKTQFTQKVGKWGTKTVEYAGLLKSKDTNVYSETGVACD
jgi:hypothetical protein